MYLTSQVSTSSAEPIDATDEDELAVLADITWIHPAEPTLMRRVKLDHPAREHQLEITVTMAQPVDPYRYTYTFTVGRAGEQKPRSTFTPPRRRTDACSGGQRRPQRRPH